MTYRDSMEIVRLMRENRRLRAALEEVLRGQVTFTQERIITEALLVGNKGLGRTDRAGSLAQRTGPAQ